MHKLITLYQVSITCHNSIPLGRATRLPRFFVNEVLNQNFFFAVLGQRVYPKPNVKGGGREDQNIMKTKRKTCRDEGEGRQSKKPGVCQEPAHWLRDGDLTLPGKSQLASSAK